MKQTSLPPGLSLGAAALLALVILLAGAPAMAESASAPLGKVTVQNNYLLTPSQILSALGLTEGAAFDPDALKAAVQKWNTESGMGTLAYRIEPAAGGRVDVTWTCRSASPSPASTSRATSACPPSACRTARG